MIINNNLSAINANRMLQINEMSTTRNMEQLSSGDRIYRAADDAAGLAISEKMRAQIRGLNQASRNIQSGISFIQATEGFLTETTNILQRLRVLANQTSNSFYAQEDRYQVQVEVNQLVSELDRIASQAQFNGINLLDGSLVGQGDLISGEISGVRLQVGANTDQGVSMSVGTMTAGALGVENLSLESIQEANSAIGVIDESLRLVSKQRADLGAYQKRLEEAREGVDIAAENLQAAESFIRDADMSTQVVDYTRDMIKSQTASAMLAQANQRPQMVLQLLG